MTGTVVVYHQQGGQTQFDGDTASYVVQADGLLVVYWETATEAGGATFAAGQWSYVGNTSTKEPNVQAARLVVTVGDPIPKPIP